MGDRRTQRGDDALKESQALLDATGQIAKVGGWEIDLPTQSLTWTAEVYRIHEVSEDFPLTVAAAIEFYAPEWRPVIVEAVQRAIEQGAAFDVELEIITARKARRWVHARGQAHAQDGKIVTVGGTFQDITDRKLAEAERDRLEVQNRQLQKADSLGRMAGAIAHHFNNQLMAVMGNLELAIDELPRDGASSPLLNAAMKAAREAADVSRLMLVYLGQSSGARARLDLSKTCLQNLPVWWASMPGNVALETDLPSPGPAVSANENEIQQVLTNLLANAWEANGTGGGIVRLAVKTVSSTDIPVACRFPVDWEPQEQSYACVEVADTGCGIPGTDIEKILDPFYSTKFTGRGMGLAVVMGIVRAHEGGLAIESEPGRGSTFRVFLPLPVRASAGSENLAGNQARRASIFA